MNKVARAAALIAMVLFVFTIIGCFGGGSEGGGGGGSYTPTYSPQPTGTGTVKGTILDENGAPLAGATVLSRETQQEHYAVRTTTVTDNQGRYILEGLPAGVRVLTAYKEQFAATFEVLVAPNTTTDAGEVHVEPVGAVEGYIKDDAGNPIRGVMMQINIGGDSPYPTPTYSPDPYPTSSPGTGVGSLQGHVEEFYTGTPIADVSITIGDLGTTTSAQGTYQLENVPAGLQMLAAEKSGYHSSTNYVFINDGAVTNYNIMLYEVRKTPRSRMVLLEVTDSQGYYKFSHLPEGTYTIRATLIGYQEASKEVTIVAGQTAAADMVMAGGIYPTPTQTPTTTPTGSGTLTGKVMQEVTGGDPVPVNFGLITIMDQGVSAYTDSSGNYQLEGVWAGERLVLIQGNGRSVTRQASILAGQTTTLDVTLPAGSQPMPTPTVSPSPSPSPTAGTGTLNIYVYGFYENNEWVGVKYVRVWEYTNYSNRWYQDWSEYAQQTRYEINCRGANLNKYYTVEVEWHNGAYQTDSSIYFYRDGQVEWIQRY